MSGYEKLVKFYTVGWMEGVSLEILYEEIEKKQVIVRAMQDDIEFMIEIHRNRCIKQLDKENEV